MNSVFVRLQPGEKVHNVNFNYLTRDGSLQHVNARSGAGDVEHVVSHGANCRVCCQLCRLNLHQKRLTCLWKRCVNNRGDMEWLTNY